MTTLSQDGKRAIDTLIHEFLQSKKTPGFVLGVSNIDEELYFHGGGPRIFDDAAGGELNPESVFWICSQTKMITALAGLKLIEQGKMTFDTPVADYLPQLANPVVVDSLSTTKTTFRPAKTVLTVKHLFNFTSGLFYPQDEDMARGNLNQGYHSKAIHASEDPLTEWFNLLKGDLPGVPLKFEPGTDFVYGWSSDILGFVIEKVSGQSLESFFKENIFKPLGMESSFYLSPELEKRLAALSWREKNGNLVPLTNQIPIIEKDPSKLKLHFGGVGLYSSMRDYLKLLRHIMQINAGKPVQNPILSQESIHSLWVPALNEAGVKSLNELLFILNFPPSLQWGTAMAINNEDWPQRRKKGAAFWSGWAGTEHFIDPAKGIAVVFGVQIAPWGDEEVMRKLFPKLEEAFLKRDTSIAGMTTLSQDGKQALDKFIKETLESKKTPGFVLGVSNADEEIYFNGGGLRVIDNPAEGQVNPDSVFWICSQTKLITALAGLKLVEQGKITFDTPVADYLPQLANLVIVDSLSTTQTTFRPAKTVLTVKHLFNFTSGLFYPQDEDAARGSLHRGYYSKDVHVTKDPLTEWFDLLKGDLPGIPVKFEPGTDFVYGWSSDILGFLIEKVSGQSLDDFFKEHIFKPLGMETSFYLTPELEKRLVALSWREKDGSLVPLTDQVPIIEKDPAKLKLHLGGVGLYSSMRDYLKLLRHIMRINAGKPVQNPILSQETIHSIWVPALNEAGVKSLNEFLVLLNFPVSLQWGTAMAIINQDWPQRRKKGVAFFLDMATLSQEGKQALDNLIKEALESKKVPGFTLGVSNIDKEIYFNGGGPRVPGDPSGGEVDPDSVFWICSQTKLITALAGLKLIEQGKITFDDPVADYFPQLGTPVIVDNLSTTHTTFRPAKNVLTVKHLFNFTSGLFYPLDEGALQGGLNRAYYSKDMHVTDDPLTEWFNLLKGDLPGVPLKFEPGTDFVYGWSSDVLGFLIEKVSGQTLDAFFKEHIFKPLGMETSFNLTPELEKRLVGLSWREKDGSLVPFTNQLTIIERDPTKLKLHLGGIGLYSSMRDYLKLLRHIMQINEEMKAGRSVPDPILKSETIRSIWVPALNEAGVKSLNDMYILSGFPVSLQWGTAMAINEQDWPQRRKKGSAFWGGWAGTDHFIDPTNGIALVFGVQITPASWADEVKRELFPKLEELVYAALTS
ncbi:hypothetical protein CVT26_006672 [Gymnopilus dilepis]|uniref:Beta-lactamase-related domain-containing protein n=1 Tax=Gymnopilus dilepis TaxID=231916 RepID=A0A409Y2P8_9AGAR|nr:hypothetical protein CVT26_006672 [Gymnopilus dilepis]